MTKKTNRFAARTRANALPLAAAAIFALTMMTVVAIPAVAAPQYVSWYDDDVNHKCSSPDATSSQLVKKWPTGTPPDFNNNSVVCYFEWRYPR